MENGQRQSGSPEQVAGSREPQRGPRPEPGKVTRTSKLSPDRGPAVQRKATAPSPRAAAPPSRSSSDATMETWMDAAHRGVTALAERGQEPVQARGDIGVQDPATVHGVAAAGVGGSGDVMPHLDRIQKAFGAAHDLSQVRAHIGGEAAAASEQIGAEAYATGERVAFRSRPDLHTAAHEAAHVVQQRAGVELQGGVGTAGDAYERQADAVADRVVQGQGAEDLLGTAAGLPRAAGAPVQMLVKNDYPWQGVIINTPSAALRSSPRKDPANPHQGTIADLPRGTRLNVTGRQGNWLQVEVTHGGRSMTGYVSQELVDDAVAAEMSSMLGEQAAWVPSGPGSGNTFETWASAPSEGAAPPLGPSTRINCWEMVLLAAYRTGAIDWAWIHDLYVNQGVDTWVSRMTQGEKKYTPGTTRVNRGDLVFFDGLAHVALATGAGDELYTFWPPPDQSSYTAGTVDQVKKSTIKALGDWMVTNFGAAPEVTYGAAAW